LRKADARLSNGKPRPFLKHLSVAIQLSCISQRNSVVAELVR
jgi:hypothetical protein